MSQEPQRIALSLAVTAAVLAVAVAWVHYAPAGAALVLSGFALCN